MEPSPSGSARCPHSAAPSLPSAPSSTPPKPATPAPSSSCATKSRTTQRLHKRLAAAGKAAQLQLAIACHHAATRPDDLGFLYIDGPRVLRHQGRAEDAPGPDEAPRTGNGRNLGHRRPRRPDAGRARCKRVAVVLGKNRADMRRSRRGLVRRLRGSAGASGAGPAPGRCWPGPGSFPCAWREPVPPDPAWRVYPLRVGTSAQTRTPSRRPRLVRRGCRARAAAGSRWGRAGRARRRCPRRWSRRN